MYSHLNTAKLYSLFILLFPITPKDNNIPYGFFIFIYLFYDKINIYIHTFYLFWDNYYKLNIFTYHDRYRAYTYKKVEKYTGTQLLLSKFIV